MGVQGAFSSVLYEGDVGAFKYPIKVQAETLAATFGAATNPAPTGDATDGLPSAKVTGSKNSIGVHPRYVTVKVTATGATVVNMTGSSIQIPILTKASYAAIKKGATGLYQGDTIVVTGKFAEHIV
jgi:hypothetical protein